MFPDIGTLEDASFALRCWSSRSRLPALNGVYVEDSVDSTAFEACFGQRDACVMCCDLDRAL